MASYNKKIFTRNATQMSLHERFTYLRQTTRSEDPVTTVRASLALQQEASARNRRLAAQMERRPAVMAALKIKQKTLRQRLGVSKMSVADRLTLGQRSMTPSFQPRAQSLPRSPRGGIRARLTVGVRGRVFRPNTQFSPRQMRNSGQSAPRGKISRSQSLGNLSRSQSSGNLNLAGRFQNQVQNRNYQGLNQSRFTLNRNPARLQRGSNRGSNFSNPRQFRGMRGLRRGQFTQPQQQPQQRGLPGNSGSFRPVARGGSRGRARGRGRGRGRGRSNPPPPSKEELDKQLDMYMANTKSSLDKELDSYMNQGN